MTFPVRLRSFFFLLMVTVPLVPVICAQCPIIAQEDDDDLTPPPPLPNPSTSTLTEPTLPETAILNNSSYTNLFFGFTLDLPIPLAGHKVMLPLMPPTQHALLAVGFQDGKRSGTMTVTAAEPTNTIVKLTDEQKLEEFRRWANFQPPARQEVPDYILTNNHFKHMSSRKGDIHYLAYWTKIKGYQVRIAVQTNDPSFVSAVQKVMGKVAFYCILSDGSLEMDNGKIFVPEGASYTGPTVPTATVQSALDQKSDDIFGLSPGYVNGDTYENFDIGLKYKLPNDWHTQDPRDVDIRLLGGIEASHEREHEFLRSCSRVLLQVTQHPRSKSGDPQPTILLRALDPACLALRSPSSGSDRDGAEELAAYLEMLSEYGEIRTIDVISVPNHPFSVFHGTIGTKTKNQALGSRLSEDVFVVRYDKLLLAWSYIAPKPTELAAMPVSLVTLGDAPPITLKPAPLSQRK